MELNVMRELVTVLSFGAFIAIVGYAMHPRNKGRFDEAARQVVDDE